MTLDNDGNIENTPENIRALRVFCGLTQKACADIYGVTLRSWQKREEPEDSANFIRMNKIHFEYLLLMADKHPKYWLKPKE